MLKEIVIVIAIAAAASAAHAAATVDQSNLAAEPVGGTIVYAPTGNNVPNGVGGFNEVTSAQFVTAGKTGKLTQIDLQVSHFAPQNINGQANLTLAKNVTFDGSGNVLTADMPAGLGGGLLSFALTGPALNFNAGDVFVIALSSESSGFSGWSVGTSPSNPFVFGVSQFDPLNYAGGLAYRELNDDPFFAIQTDYGFRTWVDSTVPEPASWAMMIAGFGMVGCAMRNRHNRGKVAIAAS